MSPRFQRRPERRNGGSGASDRPGDRWAKRGGGAGKPEWRRDGEDSGARPQRRSGPERPKPRFGEAKPRFGERRSDRAGERPGGQWRSAERSDSRGPERGSDRRPMGRGDGRPFERKSFERRSFDRKPFDRKPFERGSSERGASDRGSFARSGPRNDRYDERRSLRGDEAQAPQGEAETLGTTPPSDLIWGRHPAEAALESGRPIHRIWCTPELRHTPRFLQLLREAKASGVLVEEVTWARLGQLTGGAVHQGIVLQSAAAETLDLGSLIEGCGQIGEPPLLMAIDGLTDPHNLGAIVRSAEALGAHGMVLPQRRCAGLTGSVAKVAAGALEHLPVARVVNLNRALDTLKQEGYRVVGLAAEGNVTLEEADLDGPLVVVTGSEGDGLSLLTRRSCDQLVRIPLRGSTPSLNASVATALLLYEIARRGWMRGLTGQAPAPRIQRPQLPSPPAEERPATPKPDAERPAAMEAVSEANVDADPEMEPDITSAAAVATTPEPAPANDPWLAYADGPGFANDISL